MNFIYQNSAVISEFASRFGEENKGLSVKERRRAGMVAFKYYTVIKQKTIKV